MMKTIRDKFEAFLGDPQKRRLLIGSATAGLVIIILLLVTPSVFGPRELYIDSTAAPVSELVKDIEVDRPYYNKKVKEKTISFYRKNHNKTR